VADAPWRCSQCGTVNEPVANACRTCGRWPSLFELEGSTLESEPQVSAPPELYEPDVIETDYAEPEIREVPDAAAPFEGEVDDDAEPPKPRWQRLASLVIPIGFVLYILISALANREGG
jgi:hypothetical protein